MVVVEPDRKGEVEKNTLAVAAEKHVAGRQEAGDLGRHTVGVEPSRTKVGVERSFLSLLSASGQP